MAGFRHGRYERRRRPRRDRHEGSPVPLSAIGSFSHLSGLPPSWTCVLPPRNEVGKITPRRSDISPHAHTQRRETTGPHTVLCATPPKALVPLGWVNSFSKAPSGNPRTSFAALAKSGIQVPLSFTKWSVPLRKVARPRIGRFKNFRFHRSFPNLCR